jgi:hypothetical protein
MAVQFPLSETLGGKILESPQDFRFMDSLDGAVRLEFIRQPTPHPDLLPLSPLE